MRRIHFNALPEQTRQRLRDAIRGTAEPRPVLAHRVGGVGGVVGWALLLAITLAAALFAVTIDYGRIYHPHQGVAYLAAYFVMWWLIGYSALAAVRRIVANKATPFQRGKYLFPTDLVVAQDATLEIHPLAELSRLDPVHHYQNGAYLRTDFNFEFRDGSRQTFSVIGKPQAEQTLELFDMTQYMLSDAAQRQDWDAVRNLDVFFEARASEAFKADGDVADPGGVAGPLTAKTVPVILRWASVTALLVALVSVPIWLVRNHLSSEASFRNAVACGTVSCIGAYIRHGGSHVDEARNVHLPAAAFREAQRTGTVTALREFVVAYPQAPQVAQARQVIHQRFEEVRQRFMSQAATTDATMPAFMNALLTWLEQHDSPPVLVRFNAPSSQMLQEIDNNLPPNTSRISPHFTPERCEPRERFVTRVLQRGFAAVFPSDVMRLEHSGRLTPQTPPATENATIDVSYVVRPSGAIYVDDTSGRQFVGIHNDFVVRMQIPGSVQTHSFQLQVQPPQRFSVGASRYDPVNSGPSDGLVYSVMAERAFDQLGTALPQHFFRPGSPAYQQAVTAQPGMP